MKELLHRPALDALLTLATSDRRWRSRNQIASEASITPSTLSDALSGRQGRGLSDEALASLCDVLGIDRDALVLPVLARSGDIETARLVAEVKRLREQVLQGTDVIFRALTERQGD